MSINYVTVNVYFRNHLSSPQSSSKNIAENIIIDKTGIKSNGDKKRDMYIDTCSIETKQTTFYNTKQLDKFNPCCEE